MYISVAERLYKKVNPKSTMDVPSSAYALTEKWFNEWLTTNPTIIDEEEFFNWCVKNKS
jgi:hypothetical protein